MAKVEKRTLTQDSVLVQAAIDEVQRHMPPFLQGEVTVAMAIGTCLREGIAALVRRRLGDDANVDDFIPEHVDNRK